MVAVLEVPDSPTKSTGLFIFTICSRIQLALVVSIVGTEVKKGDDVFRVEKDRERTIMFKSTQCVYIGVF